MNFASLQFFGCALLFATAYRVSPQYVKNTVILPASSAVFLWFAADGGRAFFGLIAFGALAYLLTAMVARSHVKWRLAVSVIILLLVFAYLKRYQLLVFLPFVDRLPVFIGLSYILVRAIHVHVDCVEGQQPLPPIANYFNYIFAWPTLLAGPILLYPEFERQLHPKNPNLVCSDGAIQRIVLGYFKVLVVGFALESAYWGAIEPVVIDPTRQAKAIGLFHSLRSSDGGWVNFTSTMGDLIVGGGGASPFALGAAMVVYVIYLYFNFSGFIDIVCGLGKLMGMSLPENFDRPWRAKNMIDFWTRWHMTLANWFKTYVFNPTAKALSKTRFMGDRRDMVAVLAYFLTFFLLGVWHGPTIGYIFCGVLLGLGISLNRLHQGIAKRMLGKEMYASLCSMQIVKVISMGATVSFVGLSILPFWLSPGLLATLWVEYGFCGIAVAYLCGVMVYSPVAALVLLGERFIAGRACIAPRNISFFFFATMLILIVMRLLAFPATSAKIVYQAF